MRSPATAQPMAMPITAPRLRSLPVDMRGVGSDGPGEVAEAVPLSEEKGIDDEDWGRSTLVGDEADEVWLLPVPLVEEGSEGETVESEVKGLCVDDGEVVCDELVLADVLLSGVEADDVEDIEVVISTDSKSGI